jgi:ribonuclease HI
LLALRKARAMRIQRLIIKTDSQVVVGHIEKRLQSKRPRASKISSIPEGLRKILRRLHSQKHLKDR